MDVRRAHRADLPFVHAIAREHLRELGYVPVAAYAQSLAAGELLVVPGAGFVRFHRRRDGWATVYELCSLRRGAGRALLEAVATPRRLKCPAELVANGFYEHLGGRRAGTEPGKHRLLFVWEWT